MYLDFKNQPSTFSPPSPWLTHGEARASKTVVVFFMDHEIQLVLLMRR